MKNIFEEITKLDLPPDEYVVLGSGIMAALGLRDFDDIDLLVTDKLFKELKARDWESQEVEAEGKTKECLTFGIADASTHFWWAGGTLNLDYDTVPVMTINGVNFVSLETLLEIKKSMARDKDIRDVEMIENYLGSKK